MPTITVSIQSISSCPKRSLDSALGHAKDTGAVGHADMGDGVPHGAVRWLTATGTSRSTWTGMSGSDSSIALSPSPTRKTPGYCERTPFKVLGVLFLGE